MSELTKVEQMIKNITEMTDILNVSRIEYTCDIFKRTKYHTLHNEIAEVMLTIMIEDMVPVKGKLDSYILNYLLNLNTPLFRKYYECVPEKDKLTIVSQLNNVILLFVDKDKLEDEYPIFQKDGASYIASPGTFVRSLSAGTERSTIAKYNMIEKYLDYYFKYIDLDMTYHYLSFCRIDSTTPENSLCVKALVKRISMYEERKFSVADIISFVDFLNTNASTEARNYLINKLHEYVPTQLMIRALL